MPRSDARRRTELAAIHLGRKTLGWDDGIYRGVLQELTGKRSAKDLSAAERAIVLDFMRQRGFRRADGTRDAAGSSDRQEIMRPQLRLIRDYWTALGARGALTAGATEPALRAFVRRMTGVGALEWMTPAQASKVIEALKAWLARTERAQAEGTGQ